MHRNDDTAHNKHKHSRIASLNKKGKFVSVQVGIFRFLIG